MGQIEDLRDELLANHPTTGLPYDADDVLAADQINEVNRFVNRATMQSHEVFQAVDFAEFNALTNTVQERIWRMLAMGELNPFGVEATLMTNAFGMGSVTIITLAVLRKRPVSRAEELGLGLVRPGTVAEARALI